MKHIIYLLLLLISFTSYSQTMIIKGKQIQKSTSSNLGVVKTGNSMSVDTGGTINVNPTLQSNWNSAYSWGNHALAGYTTASYVAYNYLGLDKTSNINNGSDTRSNTAWFDYNWAGTGRVGSVINFSGLNGGYGVELFGQFGYLGNDFFLRSRNGDLNSWNIVKRIWTDADFTSTNVSDWSNNLVKYEDNRIISPINVSALKLKWGFSTWNNSGGFSHFADYLHFNTYSDGTPGSQNLLMFSKNGFGFRQYQKDWQSSDPYTNYVDYWHTGNFTQTDVDNWNNNMLLYEDRRIIKPSDIGAYRYRWGIGTYNNAGGFGNFADFLHLNTFPDGSAGNQNLIMFSKNGFGIRQYQSSFQDTNPYSNYVDYWHTGNLTPSSINNWNTAYSWGNHALAGYLTSSSLNGYATQSWVNSNTILNQDASFQSGGRFWISYGLAEGLFKAPSIQFGTPNSGSARDMQISGNYGDYTLDFTRFNGSIAQSIRVGGIFISNDYNAVAPTNGIYVKGQTISESGIYSVPTNKDFNFRINNDTNNTVRITTNKSLMVGYSSSYESGYRMDVNGMMMSQGYAMPGGSNMAFLKADGSTDYNQYLTEIPVATESTLGGVTVGMGLVVNSGRISSVHSPAQTLISGNSLDDKATIVIRNDVSDDNYALDLPNPDSHRNREVKITNRTVSNSASVGKIIFSGYDVYFSSSTVVDELITANFAILGTVSCPNCFSSITIKSTLMNGNYVWLIIDHSR